MDTPRKHMKVSAKHCFSLVEHAILIHSGVLFLCFVFGTPLCDKRMSTFSGNDSRRSTGCQDAWWLRGLTITTGWEWTQS